MTNIGLVIGWKFNHQEGMSTSDGIITEFPGGIPSQADQDAWTAEYTDSVLKFVPITELRQKRNVLLAETDWMANKDVTLPAAWKTYRQELRDLPTGLDTEEKVNAVTWPTKPS